MINEKKNKFKILIDPEAMAGTSLKFIKLKGYNTLIEHNSERFSTILANKIILVNKDTHRVDAQYNPHIESELLKNNCNNWRIDDLDDCTETRYPISINKRAEYFVDFDNGEFARKLCKNERICKHCGSIVDKSKIVGAYCERCILAKDGLGYRYSYHTFCGPYTIKEKHIDQSKTALFGAEIERDYLLGNYDGDFDDDLYRTMLAAVKTLYRDELKNENVERKAVFMRDSSLTFDGIEWITFPQTYKQYKKQANVIDEVLQIMKKYNFGNSKSVGNHIHINRKFFGDTNDNSDESRFAGAKMALLLNEYWDEFLAIAKRKDINYANKPIQNKQDKLFSLITKTLDTEHHHSVAVNLHHRDTIEIRIWAGIDNSSDLLLFLDLTQALATFAKKKSLESCQKAQFIDILSFLTDKKEHLTEIKKRLNKKSITKYDESINALIEKEGV